MPGRPGSQKTGGYIFRQQLLHTLACTLIYARPDEALFAGLPYKAEVLMLAEEPEFKITKMDMRCLAKCAQMAAHEFINNQTAESLTEKHLLMSSALVRELTNQSALIALIRHLCYHLGSCDTALRDRGLAGVY